MSSRQSAIISQWLDKVLVTYKGRERLKDEVLRATDKWPTLNLKTDAYTYESGETHLLLQIYGTLPITYRSQTYHIPLVVWFPLDYPRRPPIIYVTPTKEMAVRRSAEVEPGGRVVGGQLADWEVKPEAQSLQRLLDWCRDVWGNMPPVYSIAGKPAPSASTSASSHSRSGSAQYAGNIRQNPPADGVPQQPPRPSSFARYDSPEPLPLYGPSSSSQQPTSSQAEMPRIPQPRTPPAPPRPAPSAAVAAAGPPISPPTLPVSPFRSGTIPSTSTPPGPPPVPYHPLPPQRAGVTGPHPAMPVPPTSGQMTAAMPTHVPYRHDSAPPYPPGPNATHPFPPNANSWATSYRPYPPGPGNLPSSSVQQPAPTVQAPRPAPKPPVKDLMSADEDSEDPSDRPGPHQPTQAPPAKPLPPATLHLHSMVLSAIDARVPPILSSLDATTSQLLSTQADLATGEPAIKDEMARLQAVQAVCVGVADRMSDLVKQGESRIAELEARGEPDVDEIVCSTSIVQNQLIDLVAEDNAIEDTIYHLARALDAERIDLDKFLKQIRALAREQYTKRALVEKIDKEMRSAAR